MHIATIELLNNCEMTRYRISASFIKSYMYIVVQHNRQMDIRIMADHRTKQPHHLDLRKNSLWVISHFLLTSQQRVKRLSWVEKSEKKKTATLRKFSIVVFSARFFSITQFCIYFSHRPKAFLLRNHRGKDEEQAISTNWRTEKCDGGQKWSLCVYVCVRQHGRESSAIIIIIAIDGINGIGCGPCLSNKPWCPYFRPVYSFGGRNGISVTKQ